MRCDLLAMNSSIHINRFQELIGMVVKTISAERSSNKCKDKVTKEVHVPVRFLNTVKKTRYHDSLTPKVTREKMAPVVSIFCPRFDINIFEDARDFICGVTWRSQLK